MNRKYFRCHGYNRAFFKLKTCVLCELSRWTCGFVLSLLVSRVRIEVMEDYGTGFRHKLEKWPRSSITGFFHKTSIPEIVEGKKFVLVVDDSHLRSLVDGFVLMPEGSLSFGYSCTPGASASVLRREVQGESIPYTPDLVCLLAPGNNITESNTIEQSGRDFTSLIQCALSQWTKVIVIDFPTRLTVEHHLQDLLRQEYHRAASRLGVRYMSISEHFPQSTLDLWCRDGVHLSDNRGMPIQAQLIWTAAYLHLSMPPTHHFTPGVMSVCSRVSPKVVVTGVIKAKTQRNVYTWSNMVKGIPKGAAADLFRELTLVSVYLFYYLCDLCVRGCVPACLPVCVCVCVCV
ncbi:uncharacterized protein [Paramormyrops kingsleyae]|uniref:uncharacterized protein n=1 Tax=Paramormyrops kingsleyae TaxID=1676925 RepID=UPI003B96F914